MTGKSSDPYFGPVTIVTWLWKGWRPIYTAEHVNRLHRMLKRYMTGEWHLVCITDMPEGIECETFPLWEIPEPVGLKKGTSPNCFRRLKMFDEEMAYWFGPKVLSIDLDCNIYRDLRPLLTHDGFKCASGRHSYFNGSLWQVTPGAYPEVWRDYDPVETPRIIANTMHGNRVISGSDQAWLSIKLKHCPRWTEVDGVFQRMHMPLGRLEKSTRVLFFAGVVKPWEDRCKEQWPNFYSVEGT
jgi:hypothetical protein